MSPTVWCGGILYAPVRQDWNQEKIMREKGRAAIYLLAAVYLFGLAYKMFAHWGRKFWQVLCSW